MIQIKKIVFNAFQVNTYILYDETGECAIIDAACSSTDEEEAMANFITIHKLKPVMLLSTHAHIDHILGNAFVVDTWNLELAAHPDSEMYLEHALNHAQLYGLRLTRVINSTIKLHDEQLLNFGNSTIKVLHTPGHALGSVCFLSEEVPFVVAGDVLFYQSIGRTDLPGGDYDVLKNSIWGKLFVLPEQTIVYPGHGPETSIGSEKVSNPFVAIG
ncbi:MAG: MBL fold hydrolase [Bacteroidetes bacterium HGW-Bacteroidetes-1]|jgi:glyoxylase-like metal-dependent hydrolase (beta-lactamase superfamily II)|nr:MAG: MBL fold hydrolase [Bacteroidetes bacterium HGW-Bacteroidetes-1]